MPQRHHDGAGEGGGIHQVRAALLARVGQGVGQNQAAFGIGIDHLDGLAGHGGDDIAGPLRAAAGHVFDAGDEAPSPRTAGFSCAMARMAPSMAAPPAMSYFIFSMPSAGLMEMPPLSKVTPLPTRPR